MKIGKTSLAAQLENVLIAAFEMGSNALHQVHVAPMKKWSDWKDICKQLVRKKEQLSSKFNVIAIDTVDEAYKLCEQWVCDQNGVEKLGDIPWGQGYKMVDDEFSSSLRNLAFNGYGLFFISHAKEKTEINDLGEEKLKITPALPERPFNIVNKMVDIVAYIRQVPEQDGDEIVQKRYLFLRGDDRFHAGSRYTYIKPKVEFSYKNLVDAIYEAIDKEIELKGGTATLEANPFLVRSFDDLMEEAKTLWGKIHEKEKDKEALEILERVFGKPTRFSEIVPEQQDLLEKVLDEIKEL